MTIQRIYSRWKLGKLNLLSDYEVWEKEEFIQVMKGLNENNIS